MMIRRMTRGQFEYFKACGRMQSKWWRWLPHAVLQRKWCCMAAQRDGVTPIDFREHLDGHLALLEEIVADVLRERSRGGRLHINNTGAVLATDGREVTAFVLT